MGVQNFQEVPVTPLASIQPISGWQEFLDDGNRFLRTANTAYSNQNKIFTPEILYNLVAMAIEKFVMAALMNHGTMPYNHTMADLVEAMEDVFPGAIEVIREGLLNLDQYQDICDPYEFTITPPSKEEIPAMIALALYLQELVENKLVVNE